MYHERAFGQDRKHSGTHIHVHQTPLILASVVIVASWECIFTVGFWTPAASSQLVFLLIPPQVLLQVQQELARVSVPGAGLQPVGSGMGA